MDLVVDEVGKLQHIDVAHSDFLLKGLAGSAIVEGDLAIWRQVCLFHGSDYVLFVGAVENRACDVNAQCFGSPAQVSFQHLTDVHPGGHSQGIENYLNRGAVRQKGHVFNRQDPGDDTFVAVAAGHFVPFGNLSLLGNVDPHQLVDARRQLVAFVPAENLHVNDCAALAVRHFQRSVPHLPGFLAEDCPQKPFFCSEFSFAFRRDFSNQDVACADFRPYPDNSPLIQVL